MDTLLHILELTIPSIVVFLCAFFLIKKQFAEMNQRQIDSNNNLLKAFLDNETQKNAEARKIENAKITMPLRIQAYERLVLLLERIKPESLLLRVQSPNMTAGLLHQELLITIRAEFEHNLSQQIYVSQAAWDSVKAAKDSLIRLINEEAVNIATGAPATALSEAIIKATVSQQTSPIANALSVLKKDAENFM
ncbi:MAG: hypothetical protein IKO90_02100 [Bacteroidales bacterium]|nr:hypothetical protein [Bacteroidales bacterium]MBR7036149.1 hypothetical protein [Bacteroidales bacterium]